MSFIAEIQGKSPFHTFEDFLTSDVFTAFKYLPPHLGLVGFLRTIKGIESIIPKPDKNTVCNYYFWPWGAATNTEPDLLVEIEHKNEFYHVLFEIKYYSGLSWKDQLIRQYEDLVKGEYLVFRDGWNNQFNKLKSKPGNRMMLYLTGEILEPKDETSHFLGHFKGKKPQFFWSNWYHVCDHFKKLQKENIGFPTSLIIEDMMALLKKKGFFHFQGITKPEDLNVKKIQGVPNLFKFIDQFYCEIGLLVAEIEKSLADLGFKPLPTAKKYIGWVTTDINKSGTWRMKNLSRLYVPKDKSEPVDKSILFLISLEGSNDMKFPTVLCSILYHEPLSYEKMNKWQFYSADRFKTLSNMNSEWKELKKIKGWYGAKPGYKTKINEIKGYLLNLFDLDSDQKVKENIVVPLEEGFKTEKFDGKFTIPVHAFAGYGEG